MPSSLPHEMDAVPGATVDRWIRVAEHLNHVGAEQGATDGWTPGDVVTYFGQGPGVLLTVGDPILHMRTLDIQPDFSEFGVVDVPLENRFHIELVDRNPYSHHVGWVPALLPVPVDDESGRQQAVAAGIAAGVDVDTIHLDTVGRPARPPAATDPLGLWHPPPGYHSAQTARLTSWVEIDQNELNILVWSFLVVNHMSMTQVLTFIDGLGPFSPNQVIFAFQAARERRARETVIPSARVQPHIDVTLIRRAQPHSLAPMPVQLPRRRLMGGEHFEDQSFDRAPFREYARRRIVRDFTAANYRHIYEKPTLEEKSEFPMDGRIFPEELIAEIRTATEARTAEEATEDSFGYLRQILYQAANVAANRAYRVFGHKWISRWDRRIVDFDKANHVLVILSQKYSMLEHMGDEPEKVAAVDRYIIEFPRPPLRTWMVEEYLLSRDKPVETDWYDWQTGELPGEESKWRHLAAKKILDEGPVKDDWYEGDKEVLFWLRQFLEFKKLVLESFNKVNLREQMAAAIDFQFLAEPAEPVEPLKQTGIPMVLLVVVIAFLAFLLIY